MKHVPEQLLDVTITPVMFVLMFTYLFGGAIAGSTGEYLDYILPGILVMSVLFNTVYSGVALNTDLTKGVVDRFRSLPTWRPAPLVGALIGDSVRYVVGGTVIVVLGLVLGFRPGAGVSGVVAAMALVIVFAFGFSWIFTTLGLLLRSPNAVMNAGFIGIFPITFLSNVFVEPETLPERPGGLRGGEPRLDPRDRIPRVDGGERRGLRHRHRAGDGGHPDCGVCSADDAPLQEQGLMSAGRAIAYVGGARTETAPRPPVPELEALVTAVRAVTNRRAGWAETARLVSSALRRHLPSPDALTVEQRRGDPERYLSHPLYISPDGAFSIVALVWRPGQVTPVHDHVTWCVFGVIQGVEYEELFTLDEERDCLVEAGAGVNRTGDVSGFAPPGDIHRVHNVGDRTAISIHVYGTDVSRIGSSVRRYYELPVRPPAA